MIHERPAAVERRLVTPGPLTAVADLCPRMSQGQEFGSIVLGEAPEPWDVLAQLWRHSDRRSPFQSPAILQHHAASATELKRLFTLRRNGELRVAVVLQQDDAHNLSFLSDLKTDVNRFLVHAEADENERAAFLEELMGTVRRENLRLRLNNQPGDDPMTELVARMAEEAGLFCAVLPHSACPVVEAATPEALYAHVNGLRELRYRVNKLRNQKAAVFETFTDEHELDAWTDAFCDTHVRRWEGTPTPSNLRHPERRRFLQGCLRAWARDELLVRFSVRSAEGRIGFIIGLRAADTLVHHSTTYDPRHAKSSPGKALILHMAEWMRDNGYHTLDFGDGREDYKYTVANSERPLARLFIARKDDLRFIASTSVIRAVRSNRFLSGVYERHIKPRMKA